MIIIQLNQKKSFSLSTPNRLVVVFEGLDKEVEIKSEEIKGPNIHLQTSFKRILKSKKVNQEDIYKKKIDKGEFYFLKLRKKIKNS